jgi:hypothetical protein
MSETHAASPVHNVAREEAASADPTFVGKLQQAANLANENCDGVACAAPRYRQT